MTINSLHTTLAEAVREARKQVAHAPHSLAYDLTLIPKLDKALAQFDAEKVKPQSASTSGVTEEEKQVLRDGVAVFVKYARQYMDVVASLFALRDDGPALAERSPTKDQECFDAFIALDSACKSLRACCEKLEKVEAVAPLLVSADVRRGAECRGTFACPICGQDTPHGHSEEIQTAYREDQIRGDGWISTIKAQPKESGWYLCSDIRIDRKQRGNRGFDEQQLYWFLWVRDAMRRGIDHIPEVLYFDNFDGRWYLRNCLGNASVSGAESRWRVAAEPKYWRCVEPVAAIAAAPRAGGER